MPWISPAQSQQSKANTHRVAEGILIVAMLCLAVVTVMRIATLDAAPSPTDQATPSSNTTTP